VPELPAIVDAAEFCASEIALPRELVYGVLYQSMKLLVGGGSKTFKTWVLIDLGLSVAFGEPWLSFKTGRGRVLIVNFEIPSAFFQRRILAVARAKSITLAPGHFDLWNLRGHCSSYVELFPRIIAATRDRGYVLIILDPIYKLYGRTDENSAGDVAALMNAIEGLTVDTGAAVACGSHYAKGNAAGKEAIDRISGSGVFARDPDSILNFTRHEEPDAFTVEATLRNSPPIDPFVVRWQYPLMRRDESLDPAKLKQQHGRPPKHTEAKLLDVLKGGKKRKKLSTTAWQKECWSEKGIPKSTFYELLEKVKKLPNVQQTQAGQWFYDDPAAEKVGPKSTSRTSRSPKSGNTLVPGLDQKESEKS
jgi:hypothetical protein